MLQEKSAKICQSLLNFPANSISRVGIMYALLQDAFGSNLVLNIDDLMKNK